MNLTIGPTKIGGDVLENDFVVKEDGYSCGRIRLGFVAGATPKWLWNVNPPIPTGGKRQGQAAGLEAAKEQFKASWAEIRPKMSDHDVKHWHDLQDSVRERFGT